MSVTCFRTPQVSWALQVKHLLFCSYKKVIGSIPRDLKNTSNINIVSLVSYIFQIYIKSPNFSHYHWAYRCLEVTAPSLSAQGYWENTELKKVSFYLFVSSHCGKSRRPWRKGTVSDERLCLLFLWRFRQSITVISLLLIRVVSVRRVHKLACKSFSATMLHCLYQVGTFINYSRSLMHLIGAM